MEEMSEETKTKKRIFTCKVTSVSLPFATYDDIKSRGWSPSALLEFGYLCKKNARSEGETVLKITEMEKKIERLVGVLGSTQRQLWDLQEKAK